MPSDTFDPPGFVDDLPPEGKSAWSAFISRSMDAAAAGDPETPFDSPRPLFVNPAKVDVGPGAAIENVSWTAFPKRIAIASGSDRERWQRADASRDVQDEYCEWSIARDPESGKPTRVCFTCEGPEYWTYLASIDRDAVLELYKKHVSTDVMMDDLFDGMKRYVPRNRWNSSTSEGAMHLVQGANTLGAEIEIAGAATIVRAQPGGGVKTDQLDLIDCGNYGVRDRNSDPFIGGRMNFHARQGSLVTLANPIGIYFAGLDTQLWQTPDGSDPGALWRITRGTADRPVRAVLEVPAEKGFALSDVTIAGRPIAFGGQVADHIQMTIRAVAGPPGQAKVVPVQGCVGDRATAMGLAPTAGGGVPSVSEVLGRPTHPGRA